MNIPFVKQASQVESVIEDLLLALSHEDIAAKMDKMDFKVLGAALIYWGRFGGNRFVHQLKVPRGGGKIDRYPVKIALRDLRDAQKVEAQIREQLPDVLPESVSLWAPEGGEGFYPSYWTISDQANPDFDATLECDHFGYDWQNWHSAVREIDSHLSMMDMWADQNPKLKNKHKLKWYRRYLNAARVSVANMQEFIDKAFKAGDWQDIYHLGVVFKELGEGKAYRPLSHEEHSDFELHNRHRVKDASNSVPLKKSAAALPMPEIPEKYFENGNLAEDAWVISVPSYEQEHFDNLQTAYDHAQTKRDINRTIELRWLRGTADINEEDKRAKKLAEEQIKMLPEGYEGQLEVRLGPAIGIAWRSENDSEFKITEVWHNIRWATLYVENGKASLIRVGPGKLGGGDE